MDKWCRKHERMETEHDWSLERVDRSRERARDYQRGIRKSAMEGIVCHSCGGTEAIRASGTCRIDDGPYQTYFRCRPCRLGINP